MSLKYFLSFTRVHVNIRSLVWTVEIEISVILVYVTFVSLTSINILAFLYFSNLCSQMWYGLFKQRVLKFHFPSSFEILFFRNFERLLDVYISCHISFSGTSDCKCRINWYLQNFQGLDKHNCIFHKPFHSQWLGCSWKVEMFKRSMNLRCFCMFGNSFKYGKNFLFN